MSNRIKQFEKELKEVHSTLEDKKGRKLKVTVINMPGDGLLDSGSIRHAVENPIGWPFEYLPVKREQKTGWPEIGLMIKHKVAKYTVFLVSMYDLHKYGNAHHLIYGCPQYKYENMDELEAARWEVD